MNEANLPNPNDAGRRIRISLFCTTLLLLAMGIVMIYSASAIFADQRYGDSMFYLKKHLIFLGVGLVGAVCAMAVDCAKLRRYSMMILAVTCVLLVAVLLFAEPIGGARRWMKIAGFQFQPSEFAKLSVVLFLAHQMALRQGQLSNFKKDVLPMVGAIGGICLLILLGKDLGTTVVIGSTLLLMLFIGKMPWKYFWWLVSAAIPVVVLAIVLEPYRMKRILAFLNPWQDIQNTGFQLYQSLLAIGSGGFYGVGLGHSQQKLFYLPAAHTDFIFSIIGEELGFLGAGSVILLFMAFAVLGLMVICRCQSSFAQLFSFGLVALVVIEAMINIGVSIGALPTKGLPLPFISYGGSSLVAKMILVGLLFNISRESRGESA